MQKLTFDNLKQIFKDKRVVIMGSAPSVLENKASDIEGYDLIVRVNNYKTKGTNIRGKRYDYTPFVGSRVDYHYSFYGGSIRTKAGELQNAGIKGHLCKCPNDECHVTKWHRHNNQIQGGDFRPIYRRRRNFWVAPVYVPQRDHYMELFSLLGKHVPSTGFACIWELIQCKPKELYITGFDFMTTKQHNVDELWNAGSQDDPIKHVWDVEAKLFKDWLFGNDFIKADDVLRAKCGLT